MTKDAKSNEHFKYTREEWQRIQSKQSKTEKFLRTLRNKIWNATTCFVIRNRETGLYRKQSSMLGEITRNPSPHHLVNDWTDNVEQADVFTLLEYVENAVLPPESKAQLQMEGLTIHSMVKGQELIETTLPITTHSCLYEGICALEELAFLKKQERSKKLQEIYAGKSELEIVEVPRAPWNENKFKRAYGQLSEKIKKEAKA